MVLSFCSISFFNIQKLHLKHLSMKVVVILHPPKKTNSLSMPTKIKVYQINLHQINFTRWDSQTPFICNFTNFQMTIHFLSSRSCWVPWWQPETFKIAAIDMKPWSIFGEICWSILGVEIGEIQAVWKLWFNERHVSWLVLVGIAGNGNIYLLIYH